MEPREPGAEAVEEGKGVKQGAKAPADANPSSTSFFGGFTVECKPMPAPAPPPRLSPWPWNNWDAHYRLAVAVAAALVAGVLVQGRTGAATGLIAVWDVFAAVNLLLIWAVILTQDPYEMRRAVRLEDASRTFIFTLVVVTAAASLLAAFMNLGPARDLPRGRLASHLVLSISAVGLSWALVHTVFAMRYAHYFYEGARDGSRDKVKGGLIFPQEPHPDYLDFAYFAFVVGMTCQVSDVQISRRELRRMALWHGLIAFGFNTAILALFVNIVAGML